MYSSACHDPCTRDNNYACLLSYGLNNSREIWPPLGLPRTLRYLKSCFILTATSDWIILAVTGWLDVQRGSRQGLGSEGTGAWKRIVTVHIFIKILEWNNYWGVMGVARGARVLTPEACDTIIWRLKNMQAWNTKKYDYNTEISNWSYYI